MRSSTFSAGLDESAAYIIFGSAVGVFVVVLVIMSIAIWLIYRRRKRKRKMKGQKKPKASKKTKKKTRATKKKETTETAADTKTETRSTVNTQKSIKNADTHSTTKTQKSFQIPMVSNEDYFSINQGGKTKESKEKVGKGASFFLPKNHSRFAGAAEILNDFSRRESTLNVESGQREHRFLAITLAVSCGKI
uniref:Uncharacterized protein n=1 Tax=Bursaphelenchus xylophilus TaxID=6326 RepID=A0A1I7SJE4_BURXY